MRNWETKEVRDYELEDTLQELERDGYTIFSVIPGTKTWIYNNVQVVYYKAS